MKALRFALACSLLSILTIIAFSGAGTAQAGSAAEPVVRRHVISTNPITDMFTWYNGEYEFRVLSNSTIGLSGSYISFDDGDEEFMNIGAFYRFYPQDTAPAGFFFGARFGYYDVKAYDDFEDKEESASFGGFGIDIGYSWLLGSSQRFALSLGIGAVRLFGGDLEDVALTLPTIRLVNVGVAF